MITKRKTFRYIFLLVIFLAGFLAYSLLTVRFGTSFSIVRKDTTLIGDTRKLHRHVKELSAMIGSRSVHEYDNIEEAKEYIVSWLYSWGYTPLLQTYTYKGKKYSNIIAQIEGVKNPGEIVVIGAHYDSAHGTPGADDNASGVAVLLEICRALRGYSPDKTLRLIFFVNEEPPLYTSHQMGSYVYAKYVKGIGENITGMICLEMVGYYSNEEGGQSFPLPFMSKIYPTTPNFVAVVGNLSSRGLVRQVRNSIRAGSKIPIETLTAMSFIPGVDFSDHRSFWKMGYPAVMITDTAFYRNPNYHTETDTINTLDFNRMTELLKGLVQTAQDLTSSPPL
ncbi:MAG TPA: M28 family peptidase [Syntrophales bacterium]|nr:M28 family peptidase [Syntrophales bacterium]